MGQHERRFGEEKVDPAGTTLFLLRSRIQITNLSVQMDGGSKHDEIDTNIASLTVQKNAVVNMIKQMKI